MKHFKAFSVIFILFLMTKTIICSEDPGSDDDFDVVDKTDVPQYPYLREEEYRRAKTTSIVPKPSQDDHIDSMIKTIDEIQKITKNPNIDPKLKLSFKNAKLNNLAQEHKAAFPDSKFSLNSNPTDTELIDFKNNLLNRKPKFFPAGKEIKHFDPAWDTLEEDKEIRNPFDEIPGLAPLRLQNKITYFQNLATGVSPITPKDLDFLLSIPDYALHNNISLWNYLKKTVEMNFLNDFSSFQSPFFDQENAKLSQELLSTIKSTIKTIRQEETTERNLKNLLIKNQKEQKEIIDQATDQNRKLSEQEQQEIMLLKTQFEQIKKELKDQQKINDLEKLQAANQKAQEAIIDQATATHQKLSADETEELAQLKNEFKILTNEIAQHEDEIRKIAHALKQEQMLLNAQEKHAVLSLEEQQELAKLQANFEKQAEIIKTQQDRQWKRQIAEVTQAQGTYDPSKTKAIFEKVVLSKIPRDTVHQPFRPEIVKKYVDRLSKPFDAILAHKTSALDAYAIPFLQKIPDAALTSWISYISYLEQNHITSELHRLLTYSDLSRAEFKDVMMQVVAKIKAAKLLVPVKK